MAVPAPAQRQLENLSRGIVAVRQSNGDVCVGWRLFGTDPESLTFNLYRAAGGGVPVKVNASPLTDGAGRVIGDPDKDWRTLDEGSRTHGRILDGPEYFTVFDGRTGAALKTVDHIPSRDPIDGWGGNGGNDSYGNRCDRFLACVAYLDGTRPSVVTILTERRLPTLMHDPQYRLAIAWQNVVYNKPPHPGYFLGDGMPPPPRPDIYLVGRGEAIAGMAEN